MKNAILYFILLVGIVTGCIKDDLENLKVDNWKPEIAAPLVYSSLTVRDILSEEENEIIVIDENTRQIALVYRDELATLNANDLLKLPTFSFEHSFNISGADLTQLIQNGSVTITQSNDVDISQHTEMEIEQLVLEDGIINLEITSDIQVSGTLEIELPDFTRNGQPLKRTIPVNHTGEQVRIFETIDLKNYEVNLASGSHGNNQFGIEYVFHADHEGQTVTVADLLNIRQTFSRLRFLKLYGNIGKRQLLNESGILDIDVFKNIHAGYFELTNPKVDFFITNSFGVPIDIEISQFTSRNSYSGQRINILFQGFTNPFGIASPATGEEGGSAETEIEINTDNSNIGRLIHPAPQVIEYGVNAVANPGSATSPPKLPNFVTNLSSVEISTEILLPLEGLAHSFVLIDTLSFSFGEEFNQIDSLSFRLAVDNGFPLGATIQLYFLDENRQLTDSLFHEPARIFSPAITDEGGAVTDPVKTTTDIGYGSARVESIRNADYAVVKASLETRQALQGKIIKILDTYEIEVQLGVYVAGNLQL